MLGGAMHFDHPVEQLIAMAIDIVADRIHYQLAMAVSAEIRQARAAMKWGHFVTPGYCAVPS